MKKLMIAAAIVCAAVVSQAAQVKWSSGALTTDSQGATIEAANIIQATVYTMTAETYAKYNSMDGATLSKTIAAAIDDGSFSKLGFTLDNSGKNTYNKRSGAAVDVTGNTVYTAPTTAYALIVYEDLGNDGWYMANVASKVIDSAQNVTVGNLANIIGGAETGNATAWANVPEPTSGLLLLLGVAGLALRRRRA